MIYHGRYRSVGSITMSKHKLAVLKFGSSILANNNDIPRAIHEVYRYLCCNYKVLIVVSAIGDTTEQLWKSGRKLLDDDVSESSHVAFAKLISTGESIAACL